MKIEIEATPDGHGNHNSKVIFDGELGVCSAISILEKTAALLQQKCLQVAKSKSKRNYRKFVEDMKIKDLQ
jgi:hypothetical protein